MSAIKPKQIKKTVTGKLLTAIIDGKKYTVALTDDKHKNLIKKEIDALNIKHSKARFEKLIAMLTPVATKKTTELMVQKKVIKNEKKAVKKETKASASKSKAMLDVTKQFEDLSNLNKALTTEKDELASKNKSLEERLAALEKANAVAKEAPKQQAVSGSHRSGEH